MATKGAQINPVLEANINVGTAMAS
uniref:Uncharacterized protein n=1 Tax=Arundo donax TaxID=35708 RepID=A0A0A9BXD5_ARUDO